MDLDAWFEHARRDAAQQGLPAIEPLLRMLQRATRALRAAEWARDVPGGDEPGGAPLEGGGGNVTAGGATDDAGGAADGR